MGYANGARYNSYKQPPRPRRVWRREDHEGEKDASAAGTSARASEVEEEEKGAQGGKTTVAKENGTTAGENRGTKRKLDPNAAPFTPMLEKIERQKAELVEKIRAKKRKLAEEKILKERQRALRDAAKHSQDVAERKAKIARLQGGFDKVKKHMIDTNQIDAGAATGGPAGQAGQSNLKPTSKLAEVTKADVVRVMHAMNDYEVLRVSLASSSGEIRKNFLKLSRAFHPDKCSVEGSKEAFQRIAKAYANLKKQHS